MGISSWRFPSLWALLRNDQGGDVTRLAQENQLVATLTKVGINISSRAQSGIHRATSSDIDVWGEEIDATLGSHRSRPVNTSRPINLWIEPKINVWIFAQCQPRIDFKSNWCSMVQFWFWVTSSFQRGALLCFRLFYVERLTDMNGARGLPAAGKEGWSSGRCGGRAPTFKFK